MDVVVENTSEPAWAKEANSFRHLVLLLTTEMGARCSQVHAMAEDATVPLAELVDVCHLFTQFCKRNGQLDKAVKHLTMAADLPDKISASSETAWLTGYEGMEVGKSMSTPLENAWVAQAGFTNKGRGTDQEEKEKKEGAKETAKTPEQVQEISACYRRAMRLTGEELGTRCALLVSLANDVDATPDLLGDIGHIFGSFAENAGKFGEFASCFSAANGCSEKVTEEGHATWMAGFPTLEKHCVMTPELHTALQEMMGHVRRDQAARGASGGGGGLAGLLAMLASQSR